MKNLVAELDLLEGRLNQIKELEHASKLKKTKFILEKTETREDPEDLEAKAAQIKQQLAERKLYHCVKQVARAIKTFRQVEPLKIKKRIKASPNKQAALEAELKVVAEMNVEEWADYTAKAQLSKWFGYLLAFEKRKMESAENNVYGRVCKMSAVQDSVQAAKKALAQWFTPTEVTGATEPKVSEPREPKEAKQTATETAKAKKQAAQAAKEPKETEKPEAPQFDFDADTVSIPDIAMSDSESDDGDSFFVAADGSALPELPTGYISGSDSEPEPEPEKPVRKNRRGQRARRAIWEQKYGARAKHVLKEKEQKHKEYQEKMKKREQRERKQFQRKAADQLREQRRKELEAKPLHPSWIAKQQQEKLRGVKPQGKKIVFD